MIYLLVALSLLSWERRC